MAISSPNVVQGKENPVVSALKYANDSIKQSFQLMQNAKQLGLQEKEMNYNKNLKLLESVQNNITNRSTEIGPLAAFDENKQMLASVMSALGMSDAAIAADFRTRASNPYSQKDLDIISMNWAIEHGGDLSGVSPSVYQEFEEREKQVVESVAGKADIKVKAEVTEGKPTEAGAVNDVDAVRELAKAAGTDVSLAQRVWNLLKGATEATVGSVLNAARGILEYGNIAVTGKSSQQQDLMRDWFSKYTPPFVQRLAFPQGTTPSVPGKAPDASVMGSTASVSAANRSAIANALAKVLPGYALEELEKIPKSEEDRLRNEASVVGTDHYQKLSSADKTIASQALAKVQAIDQLRELAKGPKVGEFTALPGKVPAPSVEEAAALTKTIDLSLIGTGPKAGEDVAAFKIARAKVWEGKYVSGVTITAKLAADIANQEALIPPTSVTKTIKTNVPIDPRPNPPSNYVSSGAKNAVIPAYTTPDSVPDDKAWRVSKSLYDWWAKGAAGVDFGKGDIARSSSALSSYIDALPTEDRIKGTEAVVRNYFAFVGEGNVDKGRQRVVYGMNTAAISAEVAMKTEARLGAQLYTFPTSVNFMGVEIKAGTKMTADQIYPYIQSMMASAQQSVAVGLQSLAGSELLGETFKSAGDFLYQAALDAGKAANGDPQKAKNYWGATLATDAGRNAQNMFQNMLQIQMGLMDPSGQLMKALFDDPGVWAKSWFLGKEKYTPTVPKLGETGATGETGGLKEPGAQDFVNGVAGKQ